MKNLKLKKTDGKSLIFLIISCGLMFFPLISFALSEYVLEQCFDDNENGRCDPEETFTALPQWVVYEGLVPCKTDVCFGVSVTKESMENEMKDNNVDFKTACQNLNGYSFKDAYGTNPKKSYPKICPYPDLHCEMPCQLCHFIVMAKSIIDFFLLPPTGFVYIIGTFMLILAGGMYIVGYAISPNNPKLISQANSVITSVVIGLLICFGAWILVNLIFGILGFTSTDFGKGVKNWFEIDCKIKLPVFEPYK